MTSQLNVDTIVDKAGSGGTNVKIANNSVTVAEGGSATTTTVQGLAKSWVNFDGSAGSLSPRDSFNVNSLTDNGTGYFTITFTNAMSNDDYSRVGSAGENSNSGGNRLVGLRLPATGSFNIIAQNTSGSASDTQDTCVIALGDLA